MDSLTTWLASITWPLVSRVMVALGFGYVSYEGADTALSAALDAAKGSMAGITSEIANVVALAGFFEAMSIMSGSLVAGLAWLVAKKMMLQAAPPS